MGLGMVAGAALWCVVLMALPGWSAFGWLGGAFALASAAALIASGPRRRQVMLAELELPGCDAQSWLR